MEDAQSVVGSGGQFCEMVGSDFLYMVCSLTREPRANFPIFGMHDLQTYEPVKAILVYILTAAVAY